MTKATLVADIAAIKSTPSGEVEYDDSAQSMPLVLSDVARLFFDRIPFCPDTNAAQLLNATETLIVYLNGYGFLYYVTIADLPVDNTFKVQTSDALGYWIPIPIPFTLSDLITGTPGTGNVITWNGTHWVPSVPSISSIGWSNVSSKPAQISTDLGATDQLIKKFDVGGGANESIGRVVYESGMIVLDPRGSVVDSALGGNSEVVTTQNIPHMTSVTDSIIHTTRATLRTSSADFTVARCIIIGDPGPLDSYFVSNELNDLIIIGSDGAPTYIKQANGSVFIAGGSGGTPTLSVSIPTLLGAAVSVSALLTLTGAITGSGLNSYASLAAAQTALGAGSNKWFVNTGNNNAISKA